MPCSLVCAQMNCAFIYFNLFCCFTADNASLFGPSAVVNPQTGAENFRNHS